MSATSIPSTRSTSTKTHLESQENFLINTIGHLADRFKTYSIPNDIDSPSLMTMHHLSVVVVDNSSQHEVIQAPSDVALKDYNTTEFSILLGNVTYNLTTAQQAIVMISGNNLVTTVTIAIRVVIVIFDIFLTCCIFLLRNYEPIKSKFFVSLILVGLNVISHIQGTLDFLPWIKMYFESYWNQFLMEKSTKSVSAATFYQNNLNSSNGLPNWLVNYITFENVYCFVNSYVLYGLVVLSVALYSIQIIKLLLLTLLKDKRQDIVKSLEDFKRKQLEKFKNIKLQNKTEQQNATSNTIQNRKSLRRPAESTEDLGQFPSSASNVALNEGVSTLDLSSLSQSVNSDAPMSARGSRPSELDEISNAYSDYDDIALDLTTDDDAISTSYEEISKQGRFANLLKKIIKYRIVEISYISLWVIVWFVIISVRVASHAKDSWESVFYSWEQNSGYCRKIDRDNVSIYAIIVLFILFLAIPLFLAVDFIFSIYKYIQTRRINKEKGEKTENFFIYYFYETDPFVYRVESLFIVIFDIASGIVLVIVPSYGPISSQLTSSLVLAIGLNFLGGSISNPGITVMKGIWNFFLAFKEKRKAANLNNSDSSNDKNANAIQSIQQLLSSPICSYSIDFIISHKKERDLFYQYLREEYSVENLLFIEDLNRLRKINERHVRSKVMKIKEMTKLYLSESSSVFEINVPSKIIHTELKDYKELQNLLNNHKLKINQLPRIMKDISLRYFPNIDQSQEELMKPLITNICKPNIFPTLQTEVYKNLMDSFYRFNNSRKWKEHIKSVQSP
ncbi:predicted protein [Naegleria gruberi]|uniref:Predicted protein n=1 Tax=Naegleria gruberi TaxID=5762 RepID=D2VNK7_NAEGR|nr:uncharacterized protein NAEGRDRAFT_51023 [Naegleria gruberi]EFC41753.1 predicted protein [Naegleria gruberi]|eukprot:XP_002674497.1 predicted protein [Naegleria gruberi strain NEG-M]